MPKFLSPKSILVAAVLTATPVFAQELEVWGEAGGWDVLIDPTLGDGCLIQAAYQDGSTVRIGFDRNEGAGYVTAFNEAWGEIEEGTVYPVSFELDGASYEGEAKGIYLEDVPGADIYFTNPDFLFDIAAKNTMTIFNGDSMVLQIDLGGTMVGLEAAIECQEELG